MRQREIDEKNCMMILEIHLKIDFIYKLIATIFAATLRCSSIVSLVITTNSQFSTFSLFKKSRRVNLLITKEIRMIIFQNNDTLESFVKKNFFLTS